MASENDIKAGSIDVQIGPEDFKGTIRGERQLFQEDLPGGTVLAVVTENRVVRFTHLYRGVGHAIAECEIGEAGHHSLRFIWGVLEGVLEIWIDGELAATSRMEYVNR